MASKRIFCLKRLEWEEEILKTTGPESFDNRNLVLT